ncbi:MAG: nucleotidyltransferase family protein [Streptosporangiaceae bacterium]
MINYRGGGKPTLAAVRRLGLIGIEAVFGSVARGEDHPGSDVDLLADLPPGLSLFALDRIEADLEAILGTRVDLIPATDLKPGVRESRFASWVKGALRLIRR